MFIRHKIFVFYSILDLLFLLDKVIGDTDLSLLVSDYNIVDQDICHSIIKENPCAKNVLKILIDRIDILVDKIDDMERNQVKLQDQVSLLQSDVAIKEQQIHTLEDKLLGIVENKKRSVSAPNVYSNDLLQPSSSIDNSLYSFVRASNESNWIANNEKGRQKHSWTTYQSEVNELGQGFPQSQISYSNGRYKDDYDTYFLENEKDASYLPNKGLASSHLRKRILNSIKPNVDRQLGIFNQVGFVINQVRQLGIFNTAGIVQFYTNFFATFGLPFAFLFAVTFGGLNFFHNKVQEDVLREHKVLLDELRRDLDMLENFDATELNAKIAALEIRMDNTADSLVNLCNQLESGTGGTATSATDIECCVNVNNNKLTCTSVFFAMTPTFNIVTNLGTDVNGNAGSIGQCDTQAANVPPVTNICS